MHGFTRGLERRLAALEKRMAAVLEPESPGETARRLTLVRSALAGETPEDLTEDEGLKFTKIKASIPILQELIDDGIIDAYGRPSVGDDHHGHETEDGDELVWHP